MGGVVLETAKQEAGAFLEIKDGNALVIRQLPGPWGGYQGGGATWGLGLLPLP